MFSGHCIKLGQASRHALEALTTGRIRLSRRPHPIMVGKRYLPQNRIAERPSRLPFCNKFHRNFTAGDLVTTLMRTPATI